MQQDSVSETDAQTRRTETGALKRSRRPRAAVACDSCRTRKVKCNGGFPCSSCTQHSFECSYKDRQPHVIFNRLYEVSHLDPVSQLQLRPSPLSEAAASTELQPTLPISLGDDPISEPSLAVTDTTDAAHNERTAHSEDDPAGLGEVNRHTGGSEFYGRSGTFYFLSKLRSHASSEHQLGRRGDTIEGPTSDSSVVNLLHSPDRGPPEEHEPDSSQTNTTHREVAGGERTSIPSSALNLHIQPNALLAEFEVEIQRECVRLYFENLHCVHPVLNHSSFIARCEEEIWLRKSQDATVKSSSMKRETQRFMSLFNTVLALGAITAGETSLLTWDRTIKFLDNRGGNDPFSNPPQYTPIRVARLYFEAAKTLLGDVFESSSFETVQTLFLMAVFCQNALNPHSCYMYSGMALRTALAIGIPTTKQAQSHRESLLWWALYAFEIEMCSSAGRQSFLHAPEHYGIPLLAVTATRDPLLPFVNCMVDLARILANIAANASRPDGESTMTENSNRSFELEKRLKDWRSQLPETLNLESSSLNENELITKQKVVLKLRFLNFKVLIHRPFLLHKMAERNSTSSRHVSSCVEAARETIRFVYDIYMYRPYFRTWWYNCTYVLDASMVLLYVVLTNTCPFPVEAILNDIDKSLEIFASMNTLAVARRCTDITKEVLSAAKKMHVDLYLRTGEMTDIDPMARRQHTTTQAGLYPTFSREPGNDGAIGDIDGEELSYEDLYASLVDPNLLYNFLNFDDWNAWSAIGLGDEGEQEQTE